MNEIEHLLACLSEECAEVSHAVSKALRFGLNDVKRGQQYTNAERIALELTDLLAVVDMLEKEGVITVAKDEASLGRKKSRVVGYMSYARQRGTLYWKNPTG